MFDRAIKKARAHAYDASLGYRLCAIIARKNHIVSVGFNSFVKVDDFENFSPIVCDALKSLTKPGGPNIHAEMDAIERLDENIDVSRCRMYVVRIKKAGHVGMARPCPMCEAMLRRKGLRRVFYTINDDVNGFMKLLRSGETIDHVLNSGDET